MNILNELKARLEDIVTKRNEVERQLKLNDHYIKFVELNEEISEVNRAIKALEHSCNHYGMQSIINARQGY